MCALVCEQGAQTGAGSWQLQLLPRKRNGMEALSEGAQVLPSHNQPAMHSSWLISYAASLDPLLMWPCLYMQEC